MVIFYFLVNETLLVSLVGSDDRHEELLAAANAVINPGTFLSK